ncbi:hypothetical protein [Achromobacter phage Motura]|uniref:Uncharacterized protein n=1 Tax=Achromobacter phage Motura TaxID=2591403 RepID=A0A514CSE8_9CAUD|nr:hypothetical protein H1O15_gp060 [Achromobacter phage Motura]QDH83402.1 hypothetical protein [Achromobacter phage Motura]
MHIEFSESPYKSATESISQLRERLKAYRIQTSAEAKARVKLIENLDLNAFTVYLGPVENAQHRN